MRTVADRLPYFLRAAVARQSGNFLDNMRCKANPAPVGTLERGDFPLGTPVLQGPDGDLGQKAEVVVGEREPLLVSPLRPVRF